VHLLPQIGERGIVLGEQAAQGRAGLVGLQGRQQDQLGAFLAELRARVCPGRTVAGAAQLG